MHQAQRALEIRLRQFRIELSDLRSQQQPLINDGARRERRHIEIILLAEITRRNLAFRPFADHVELAFERIFRHALTRPNEQLLNIRLGHARDATDGIAVGRRIAPPKHREPFFAYDALQNAFTRQALMRLHRQEDHAHAVGARRREHPPQFLRLAGKKLMRDLQQQPCAIARFAIAPASSAVCQLDQDLDALLDNFVRGLAFNVRDETDPAGVMLVAGVIQSLGSRETIQQGRLVHVHFLDFRM